MVTRLPDFRAVVTFISKEAGGRASQPFQGYRPDLAYKTGAFELFMIWPRFLDATLVEYGAGISIPNPCTANFWIMNAELEKTIHRKRIRPGTEFWMCEGNRKVASVVVEELLGELRDSANQLPDPTSPSVTPPAGAGGAPSVAADH
jgi:translation elongation factor EF-Tu-like GTPase